MIYNSVYIITSLYNLDIPLIISKIKAKNKMAVEKLESIVYVKSPLAFLYFEEPYDVILLAEDPILNDLKTRFISQNVFFIVV